MKVLILFCHPSGDSFAGAVLDAVTERLAQSGQDVVVRDLYAETFDPVMSPGEWANYEAGGERPADITSHAADLAWCDAIILIFPTWWYGLPAMLKGYFDRVWTPGVAFGLTPGRALDTTLLNHVTRFVVITSYGSPWWWIRWLLRDPVRNAVSRGLGKFLSPRCKLSWFALYDMDRNSAARRRKFLHRVARGMGIFDRPLP